MTEEAEAGSLPAQASQLLRARTADWHARPIIELRLELAARIAPECADVVEVHDVRAMNLGEALRIETRDQAVQR